MNLKKIATELSVLADFLGKRDIKTLTGIELENKYNFSQADLLILFGGSIAAGCDLAAEAMIHNAASRLMIVGGEGHTTDFLRNVLHTANPLIQTQNRMEADIMADYLLRKYGIKDIIIENKSTNCGNNITNALAKLQKENVTADSIILIQDAAMQRRMDAGFRKYAADKVIINYAAYKACFTVEDNKLAVLPSDIWGMWDPIHYITLLMGEIPRLSDDENGYGPKGKNFIAHVDIPAEVLAAYEYLVANIETKTRIANPAYKS